MVDPRRGPRPLHSALVQLALVIGGAGSVEAALLQAGPYGPLWALLLFVLGAWVYAAMGLLAQWRRPGNRLGSVLLGGSAAWLSAGLFNCGVPVLEGIGALTATLPLAIVVHLLHAFPSGRLADRGSRGAVLLSYITALVFQLPQVVFVPGFFELSSRPGLAHDGETAQNVLGVLVMLATAVLLVRRLGRYEPAERRIVIPLLAFGTLAVVFVALSGRIAGEVLGVTPLERAVGQIFVLMGVPVAFALVVLRGGFARSGQLEELGAWLGSDGLTRSLLVEALVSTLGDPSAQVLYLTSSGGYIDHNGVAMIATRTPTRGLVPITVGSRAVGAITYDTRLTAQRETVVAAAAVIAVAVDRERLTAELLASQASLRLAAVRVVEAGERERRRIAQDLHDGLQADLVLLAIQAQHVATSTDHAEEALDLRRRLDAAAANLRSIVNGVMPALLVERGLYAAVQDLADRLPIPTTVSATGSASDLPHSIESSAYFVVAEALANAVKHSGAGQLEVVLNRQDEVLRIEIADDGVGGAASSAGIGLTGIGDRVGVLGGSVQVTSPPGRGTRLVLDLPCVS